MMESSGRAQTESERDPMISQSSPTSGANANNTFIAIIAYAINYYCSFFRFLFFRFDFMLLLWSVISFIADVISDTLLILEYYRNGDVWYCGFTIAFRVTPAFIITVLSFINYYQRWKFVDKINKSNDEYQLKEKYIVDSNGRFIFRSVFTFFMLNPIAR